MGLGDGMAEGVFRWVNGQAAQWSKWASTEPNGNTGENCVTSTEDDGFKWIDTACNAARYYVCQSPPGATVTASSFQFKNTL